MRPPRRLASMLLCFAVAGAAAALCPRVAAAQDAPPPDPIASLEARARAATGEERAARFAELARALESAGRPAEAAAAWKESGAARGSLEAAAGEARCLLAFAEDVLASGDAGASVHGAFEDARRALVRARAAGDRTAAIGLARCAAAEGRSDEEIAILTAAVAAAPDDLAARRALAFAHLNAGNRAEALPRFRELSDADPADLKLSLCLAAAARATGDGATALAAADRALASHPDDRRSWEALWQVFAPEKRWDELADLLVRRSDAMPQNARAAHYAGYACLSAQRIDAGVAYLERAWTLDPKDVDAKLDAARALLTSKRDRDRAGELAREVLLAEPGNRKAADLLSYIAMRRSEAGDHAASVRDLEALAEARPDDRIVLANLALERRWAGDYRGAEATYDRARALDPTDAQTWNDYGLLLLVLGRTADAERAFLTGHEAQPAANDVVENLAWIARERGDLAAAAHWHRIAYASALARGADASRHRRNLDDVTWPLPPLATRR